MNLVLFEPAEIDRPLSRTDRRAIHILDVLRRKVGDTFDAGAVNGPRGKATLVAVDAAALMLSFAAESAPPGAEPITLLAGLPRPQTARDILRDATTLGVGAIHFVRTEKGDVNYARSSLWSSGEWRRHALVGAEQAFSTHVPAITHGLSLADAVATLPPGGTRLALDNYQSPAPLGQHAFRNRASVALAVGGERGWSDAERDLLRREGFSLVHLGARVLRTETACTAAIAIIRAQLGLP
ncbi:MAG: RsmE family RNA methyltransferase [Opitutaceae bacterium]